MTKKYRLKINYSEITDDNFIWVQRMREKSVDGEICRPYTKEGEYYFEKKDIFFEIPKSWLTEIKEPLTDDEAWKAYKIKYHGEENSLSDKNYFKGGWNACLENYKLEKESKG